MEFFTFKKDNAISILTETEGISINSNGEFETPVALSTKEILNLIKELKADKEKIKAFYSNLNELDYDTTVELATTYYDLDRSLVFNTLVDNAKCVYTIDKKIATDMLTPVGDDYLAKIRILAKPGTKFGLLKTYTKEEIDQMLKDEQIIILDFEPYKKSNKSGRIYRVSTAKHTFLTEEAYATFEWLLKYNKETYHNLLCDLDKTAIKKDFEEQYLPAYKKCIAYLTECAKTSIVHEQQEIKQMQNKIQKSKNTIEDLTNVQKTLLDTSKGR